MKPLILFLLILISLGCQKKPEDSFSPSIQIRGVADFGKVLLGDQMDSIVTLDNSKSSASTSVLFQISSPFFILSYEPSSCSTTSVPSGTVCNYKLRFAPSVVGSFQSVLLFKGETANFYGIGIKPGEISASPTSFNAGQVQAGSINDFPVRLTNTGASDVLYPSFNAPPELTVSGTTCPTVIRSNNQCIVYVRFIPKETNPAYLGAMTILSSDSPIQLTVAASIKPGASDGNITFSLNPSVLDLTVASPSVQPIPVTVTTTPIKDKYGNLIEDGTPVTINTFNLDLQEDPVNHNHTQLFTRNGVVSFTVTASTVLGLANFSAQTETSYGSYSINVKN